MIPTEPIGSLPQSPLLLAAAGAGGDGAGMRPDPLYEAAIKETIEKFEATGSPVVTDAEQNNHGWLYAVNGATNIAPDGLNIPFAAGPGRRAHRLTEGPFRYRAYADSYLDVALRYASRPVKQAVVSPSTLSLMYPAADIPGYNRETFIDDLIREHETEIRRCLAKGAYKVQINFTEGSLAVRLDPSGCLLDSFVVLHNLALSRFDGEQRQRIGVHTCPGGGRDAGHGPKVDYSELLPGLFSLQAGNFYISMAVEKQRKRILKIVRDHIKPDQRIFIGVISTVDPRIETPEEVRDRVLEAADYIPVEQLGTTDDCSYTHFCTDVTTSRKIAFAKIRARVEGTRLASGILEYAQ